MGAPQIKPVKAAVAVEAGEVPGSDQHALLCQARVAVTAGGGVRSAEPRLRRSGVAAIDITAETAPVIGVGIIAVDAKVVPPAVTEMPPGRDARLPEAAEHVGRAGAGARAPVVASPSGQLAPVPPWPEKHLVDAQDEGSLVAPVRGVGRGAPRAGR